MRSLLLTLALATAVTAAAPARLNKKKTPDRATDATIVAELHKAYRVLDRAEPIYHGHRARAKEEINHAIGQLQKEMHKHGLKMHHHEDGVKETKAVSDAQVRESARELVVVLKQLRSLPASAHRTKAAAHLATAVAEMDKGLLAAKKGK